MSAKEKRPIQNLRGYFLYLLLEGYGNFSFEMGLYRSAEYLKPYDVSEYPVNIDPFGQLYCQAKLDTSDPDLILRADMCVATPSMDPSHSIQYKFIDNGRVFC